MRSEVSRLLASLAGSSYIPLTLQGKSDEQCKTPFRGADVYVARWPGHARPVVAKRLHTNDGKEVTAGASELLASSTRRGT